MIIVQFPLNGTPVRVKMDGVWTAVPERLEHDAIVKLLEAMNEVPGYHPQPPIREAVEALGGTVLVDEVSPFPSVEGVIY